MEPQNPNVFEALPAGAMTWGGKTQGPAICVGRLRPHVLGPRVLWISLDELRDMNVKAGLHTEQDYKLLEAAHDELKDLLVDADAKISELEDKIDALEKAFGWKPKEKPQNGNGEDRERDVQEGRVAPVARSAAGAKDSGVKDGGGKGRKVRAASQKAG